MMGRKSFSILAAVFAVTMILAGLVLVPLVQGANGATPAAGTPSAAVVRQVIDTGEPAAAPGQLLQLVRYIIPPKTSLPVHEHPGMQVAQLVSGELTYRVVKGEVHITRAASNGTPGAAEVLTAGHETTFHPGDSWVESAGMIHAARNDGTTPVVILVASLLAANQPSAILIPATPTP